MVTADIIQIALLLAVFASVFLISQILMRAGAERAVQFSAVNRRLKLIGQGADRIDILAAFRRNDPTLGALGEGFFSRRFSAFQRNLMMAELPFRPIHVALVMAGLFIALAIVIFFLASLNGFALTFGIVQLVVTISGAIAFFIPLSIVSFLGQRKRKRMQEQFPVALDIFVRALRSGHPIASAIELLTQEMEDPLGSQFGLVADEVSYGSDLTEALFRMAERWDLDDIRMFVVCLAVQNETGGNLAEILENLSHVIRERASLYMKVRALSSEGRMTGWILGVLPIFTFVFLFIVNPRFYLEVARDPIFYIGFPILIVWYLFGIFMIRRIIDLKV